MSIYIVGDIHGCFKEFLILLKKSNFNSKFDKILFTGDLVSRGPLSLEVLKFIFQLGDSAIVVLGNHDLKLLSVYFGNKVFSKKDNFDNILNYLEVEKLMQWLRTRPFCFVDHKTKIILSHAGLYPKWDISTAVQCSNELQRVFSIDELYMKFLKCIPDNSINIWNNNLSYMDKIKFSINVFTRMRYIYTNNKLNFSCKLHPKYADFRLKPWFSINNHINKNYKIFFGHWSTLGTDLLIPKNIIPLDTGCCWGGQLTMFRLDDQKYFKTCCRY